MRLNEKNFNQTKEIRQNNFDEEDSESSPVKLRKPIVEQQLGDQSSILQPENITHITGTFEPNSSSVIEQAPPKFQIKMKEQSALEYIVDDDDEVESIMSSAKKSDRSGPPQMSYQEIPSHHTISQTSKSNTVTIYEP